MEEKTGERKVRLKDIAKARDYMRDKAEPLIKKLVQELAVEQPEDVLGYMIYFAERELEGEPEEDGIPAESKEKEEKEEQYDEEEFEHEIENDGEVVEHESDDQNTNETDEQVDKMEDEDVEDEELNEEEDEQPCVNEEETPNAQCCVSGSPAELKVKLPGSEKVEYYSRDIFDALKRKNKLRGAVAVELDEEFPEMEVTDEAPFPITEEEKERIANTKSVDEVDSRPVTPPRRGFEMTRPGENYHNGEGPRIVGNVGPVSFEPRALGEGNAADKKAAALEAAEKRAKESVVNLSPEQLEELKLKRKKDELVGKISAHYASMGTDAPVGLAAASVETLQRHFAKIRVKTDESKVDRDNEERTGEREIKARSLMKHVVSGAGSGTTQDRHVQPQQTLSFEPRALGGSESTENCPQPDSLQKRRERAAQAALRRLSGPVN